MKRVVLLILLPCTCLLGCKRCEERIEQVVWQNRTSYGLNIAVYMHDDDIWSVSIEKGAEIMVYNQTYRLCPPSKKVKSNEPAHYLPFEGPNWLCERGQIDSLIISDAATDLELMRCKKQYPSYRPFFGSRQLFARVHCPRHSFHHWDNGQNVRSFERGMPMLRK